MYNKEKELELKTIIKFLKDSYDRDITYDCVYKTDHNPIKLDREYVSDEHRVFYEGDFDKYVSEVKSKFSIPYSSREIIDYIQEIHPFNNEDFIM